MNLDEIKELIGVMRKNKIRELELDQSDCRLRLVSSEPPSQTEMGMGMMAAPTPYMMAMQPMQQPALAAPAPMAGTLAPAVAAPAAPAVAPAPINGKEIVSPMVGTFYISPAPDAAPYIELGATVHPDTVVCIVEAMKLMNEIKADVSGRITRILVENGQPVEYGQPLFIVEP
jgi:acetyl-CoA carboxylase biotin carboxyl carrier protein